MKPLHYLLIALLTTGAFVFLYKKTYQHVPQMEVQIAKKQNKELFLGKRKLHSAPKVQPDKIYPGCEELETTLNDIDFRRPVEEWSTTIELRELDLCEDPFLEDKLKIASDSCFSKKPDHKNCVSNLVFLRSMLRTRFEEDAHNPENVADLVIREFAQKQPDFKKLNKYSEKLLDLNPSNRLYQKMWATSKFIAAVESNNKNLPSGMQDEIYRRLDPELINDIEFQPYRFFLETASDPARAEEFARNFAEQHPTHSQAHEILGWSLWKQGRKEEAIYSLEQAIKYNPNDPWLKKMYADVKSRNAGKNSYEGRLHMSLQLEDLFD